MDGSFLDASSTLIPSTWEWSDLRYYYVLDPFLYVFTRRVLVLVLSSSTKTP